MLARPVADLVLGAVRPTVAVGAVSVVLLQELLILAFQVPFQDDAVDGDAAVLLAKPAFLLPIGGVQIRVVIDFALATDASVERLRRLIVPLDGVRIEKLAALLRERHAARIVTQIHRLDEPLVAQMAECVVVYVQVVFGRDAEGADDSERTAVFAVQLVYTIAIDDQLSLLAARQIEIAHQTVAWIVVVPVPFVVHVFATLIASIAVARVISRIKHRCLPTWRCVRLSVKASGQVLRGAIQVAR